jgi:hypothetical protein
MITNDKNFTIQTGQNHTDASVNISAGFYFETQDEANRFYSLFNSADFERIISDHINTPVPQAIPPLISLAELIRESERLNGIDSSRRGMLTLEALDHARNRISAQDEQIREGVRISNLINNTIDENNKIIGAKLEASLETTQTTQTIEVIKVIEDVNSISSLDLENESITTENKNVISSK